MVVFKLAPLVPSFLLLASALKVPETPQPPHVAIARPNYRFGRVVRGTVVKHDFVLKNDGQGPLRILQTQLTSPLVVMHLPDQIAPRQETVLRIELDTRNLEGSFDGEISLALNDPAQTEATLSFDGEVVPVSKTAASKRTLGHRLRHRARQLLGFVQPGKPVR